MVGTIDETAPHHNTAKGLQCLCQHIGSVSMRTVVVARTGLSFTIGFYQKTAKIGNQLIDFTGLALPPARHTGVFRVCGLGITECHRGGEIDGEEDADTIRTQDVGYLLHLTQILLREHLGRCIDIIEHRTVDTDGGIGTCIVADELLVQVKPLEDAVAGIAAFDTAVEIIPMVEQTQLKEGLLCLVIDATVGSLQAQHLISTIQQSDVMAGGNHELVVASSNRKTVIVGQGGVDAQHNVRPLEIVFQFTLGYRDSGRTCRGFYLCTAVDVITQPETMTVFCLCKSHCQYSEDGNK